MNTNVYIRLMHKISPSKSTSLQWDHLLVSQLLGIFRFYINTRIFKEWVCPDTLEVWSIFSVFISQVSCTDGLLWKYELHTGV